MDRHVKTFNSFDDIGTMHKNFKENGSLTTTVIDENTIDMTEKTKESSTHNEVKTLDSFEDILKLVK